MNKEMHIIVTIYKKFNHCWIILLENTRQKKQIY